MIVYYLDASAIYAEELDIKDPNPALMQNECATMLTHSRRDIFAEVRDD